MNRGDYGDVERGERNLSLANIVKIAEALDAPTSQVLLRAERLRGSVSV